MWSICTRILMQSRLSTLNWSSRTMAQHSRSACGHARSHARSVSRSDSRHSTRRDSATHLLIKLTRRVRLSVSKTLRQQLVIVSIKLFHSCQHLVVRLAVPDWPRYRLQRQERSHEETLHKKDAPAEQRGIWRNIITSSRMRTKLRFYTPVEARVLPSPTSKRPEEREFVADSGASMHMLSKMDSAQTNWNPSKVQEPSQRWLRPMVMCKQKSTYTILISS